MVFTCVTDTSRLIWDLGPTANHLYYNTNQLNVSIAKDIFTLVLRNITGSIFHSTASAVHVPMNYSGQNVTCQDGTDAATLNILIG